MCYSKQKIDGYRNREDYLKAAICREEKTNECNKVVSS